MWERIGAGLLAYLGVYLALDLFVVADVTADMFEHPLRSAFVDVETVGLLATVGAVFTGYSLGRWTDWWLKSTGRGSGKSRSSSTSGSE